MKQVSKDELQQIKSLNNNVYTTVICKKKKSKRKKYCVEDSYKNQNALKRYYYDIKWNTISTKAYNSKKMAIDSVFMAFKDNKLTENQKFSLLKLVNQVYK